MLRTVYRNQYSLEHCALLRPELFESIHLSLPTCPGFLTVVRRVRRGKVKARKVPIVMATNHGASGLPPRAAELFRTCAVFWMVSLRKPKNPVPGPISGSR